MPAPLICWFKRDLRVQDHPALAHAVRLGPVIPLYIVEPEMWAQGDASGRHYAVLREALDSLREALSGIGLPLILRVGEAVPVLENLRAAHGVKNLVSHEETGNGWSFARDRRVADWARGQGVTWHEMPQCGVMRRLDNRDRWQGARDAFMRAPLVPTIAGAVTRAGITSDPMPEAHALGLEDHCPGRQRGGRRAAERALESFLATRGESYTRAMSSPLTGARACSRLSPHLAVGTLSIREAVQAGRGAPTGRGADWTRAMRSFQARLAWRDHFMQKLEDEPAIEHRCLHPAYEDLRPAEPDAARLGAWARGETGLPFVDACMRSLIATGWLNFRMRSMLMAVASYHLWLDWRATGAVLARYFTDYEPGIHWSQVQMQSGTTGMNTIRIYNPIKQGLDQDPTGAFTRAWVPELAGVPDAHLQRPWDWDGAGSLLGKRYPAPIVDPVAAAKAAKEAVYACRAAHRGDVETARIVQKHASRKRQRRKPRNDAQLSLDL
ncbi:Cryptochrome-like protein cry2 [Roseovarius tolerans]|uniref:Cryptochrome-like protein cry2 n=2 Tax=Roseovarius tolerans TaxID=74031 RepID=A0A0L6CYX7_9RHOB|nr:FAD-binding domain-containing protein [Roseovarius tolerans]KNX42915.1 Cryptochrome-like protein cry2 [Roseovarius tolerans]